METAEVKTTSKRIRHLYPRKEIYHRFVHSGNYAYTPDNNHQVSCLGNYMVLGRINSKQTINDFEEMWHCNSERMLAIIDREQKRIMLNMTYNYHVYDLIRAIPDDYKVFRTDKIFYDKNILSNLEECLYRHYIYSVEELITHHFLPYYNILYNNGKVLNFNIIVEQSDPCYQLKQLIKFIKENKLYKYDWYSKKFNAKYVLRFVNSNWITNKVGIKLPSPRQLIHHTFFTNKQKLLLEQRWFWSRYCNGNSISFKDVVAHWNEEITIDWADKYFDEHFIYFNKEWFLQYKVPITFNECIRKTIECNNAHKRKYIQEQKDESDRNELKAKEEYNELLKQVYTVNDWREGKKPISNKGIEYRKFIPPRNSREFGKWITATYIEYGNGTVFPNTQLKLVNNEIITSQHAKVPLEAGIKMFKMFMRGRNNNPTNISWTTTDFGDVKVGIYNLRYITYTTKKTDNGKYLNYKDWLIQIGCHSIWLEEVMDFIKYYNLEDKFIY